MSRSFVEAQMSIIVENVNVWTGKSLTSTCLQVIIETFSGTHLVKWKDDMFFFTRAHLVKLKDDMFFFTQAHLVKWKDDMFILETNEIMTIA